MPHLAHVTAHVQRHPGMAGMFIACSQACSIFHFFPPLSQDDSRCPHDNLEMSCRSSEHDMLHDCVEPTPEALSQPPWLWPLIATHLDDKADFRLACKAFCGATFTTASALRWRRLASADLQELPDLMAKCKVLSHITKIDASAGLGRSAIASTDTALAPIAQLNHVSQDMRHT